MKLIMYITIAVVLLATFKINATPISSSPSDEILLNILCLVNRERANANVRPLVLDE
jgi:hypothetical protein